MSEKLICKAAVPPPKTIWMLWLQGWDNAPEVVRTCRATWEAHNPNWTVHALCADNMYEYIGREGLSPYISGKNIPPEALSDIVRILLLEQYGGLWIDSTAYCLKPLDVWLPEKLASGFFAFAKPGPDRMLSSWFLASSQRNYIVQEWHKKVLGYWASHVERDCYFWFHYLFAECYRSNSNFRAIWDMTPEFLADEPHRYLPYTKLAEPLAPSDLECLAAATTPVLKLTHKLSRVQLPGNSVLTHLIERMKNPGYSARICVTT
jgi:hypothetical protein